ncbi:MAG: hypothetical protein ATN33_06325 [Epulopiscium sp. Nele67-Bin001]|nr:MAG: hypothetical protein ATN33_06325 [Epulopiscium sp. Nele67-Bin001]
MVVFDEWANDPSMVHAFSTKNGGVSTGAYATLNLGFNRGDEAANVLENYKRVAEFLGVDIGSFVASAQTHKCEVLQVSYDDLGNGILSANKFKDIDAIYTTDKGVTLVTYYADCVPLFFYAPKHHIIGIAHAGWRGTFGEIGKRMATIWHEKHCIPYEDMEVVIGPSICKNCFEVHTDVSDIFMQKEIFEQFVVPSSIEGKFNIDLWACNKKSLESVGINKISIANRCTCCEEDNFFSHRRSLGIRGSLAAFMGLIE